MLKGLTSCLRLAYGPTPQQFGELRIPSGSGPHPVAVVLHGGCWHNHVTLDSMSPLCVALTSEGLATWNIEYRRIGDPDSDYPNPLTDVGLAIDHVRELAREHNLDLKRVVSIGHSAGAHLGFFAAARGKLADNNRLRGTHPLPQLAAISLAGILNLAKSVELKVCRGSAAKLLGGMPAEIPERYAEASPSQLPLDLPQVLIHGTNDRAVPISLSRDYLDDIKKEAQPAGAGDVSLAEIEGCDHLELISPDSPHWDKVKLRILAAFRNET